MLSHDDDDEAIGVNDSDEDSRTSTSNIRHCVRQMLPYSAPSPRPCVEIWAFASQFATVIISRVQHARDRRNHEYHLTRNCPTNLILCSAIFKAQRIFWMDSMGARCSRAPVMWGIIPYSCKQLLWATLMFGTGLSEMTCAMFQAFPVATTKVTCSRGSMAIRASLSKS